MADQYLDATYRIAQRTRHFARHAAEVEDVPLDVAVCGVQSQAVAMAINMFGREAVASLLRQEADMIEAGSDDERMALARAAPAGRA